MSTASIQFITADIILRRAMDRKDEAFNEASLSAQTLSQVQDELVIEASEADVEALISVLRSTMKQPKI